MKWSLITNLAVLAPVSSTYVWPSQQDSLDDLLFLQSGYIRNGALSDQVKSCDFGANAPGIQKAAEWLRTAFHDSVTHDAASQTGGLDASIQYELDRPENLGGALNNTLSDISSSVNKYTSAADVLALSMVMAVARCGKFFIPLRTGRIDATEAGIKGVPEATTDLNTTRKRFETASFNEADMITLVACGHSIGSVHSVDHPEIVSGTPAEANIAHFDTTSDVLDNAVVTEYLNNSTSNPLIRNTNDTLNSDKRVFSSDGDVTMRRLADGDYFKSQCESLLTRMINLVPGNVNLSEPLVPADVRPYIVSYQFNGNGSIEFVGHIRVRTSPVTGRDPATLTATIVPIYSNGDQGPDITTTRPSFLGGVSSGYLTESLQWFEFNQTLEAGKTLKAFNIRINNVTYDNAGTGGYPVSSDVVFQLRQSCLVFDDVTFNGNATVVAAISKSLLGNSTDVPQINVIRRIKSQGNHIPRLSSVVTPMVRTTKETADYVYYSVSTILDSETTSSTFDVECGGSKVDFLQVSTLSGRDNCQAL